MALEREYPDQVAQSLSQMGSFSQCFDSPLRSLEMNLCLVSVDKIPLVFIIDKECPASGSVSHKLHQSSP